ncbi:hypothetical protein NUU61_004102 [Penicillium alfredii]|uniref:SUN domain-containing protein n=1 Tax=Penicillium alfredii TaxID=1506179 RepID=A0A9W9KCY9_9EURO|nr:uncharacterized protein NUU61_004102 [Penicillium alfredii]KAJ5101880.1 hypothetical protein NUU61_004102 [Penicillium alfredii]
MPPKRATTRRGGGPKDSTPRSEDQLKPLLDTSESLLPSVQLWHSSNYGGNTRAALSRKAMSPTMNIDDMARNIDAGLEAVRKRNPTPTKRTAQKDNEPQRATRSGRGPAPYSASPVRQRSKREPTPDQTQLLQSLRNATVSPAAGDSNDRSEATPTPPIPRTVSTDSSPAAQPPFQRRLSALSNSPLYPSPLQRAGEPNHDMAMPLGSSPGRHSSVDNASEVSWNLERDIHEDNLQRTRPGKYRGEKHGRNITAPPRRPSGLAIVQEAIDEEDEEEEVEEEASGHEDEPQLVAEPTPNATPKTWTAPVRTIIPQFFRSEPPLDSPIPKSPKEGLVHRWLESVRPESRDGPVVAPNRTMWIRAGAALLLSLLLFLAIQSGFLWKLGSSLSSGEPSLDFPPNMADSELVKGLRSQVSKINNQVSALSRELSSVRSDHAHDPAPTYITDPIDMPRKPIYKVNFLSRALGAIVDPDNTTPTAGSRRHWSARAFIKMFRLGDNFRSPQPPAAALTPWEDVGDCWCSVPRDGMSQLSVLLEKAIVPEEVVVEHIPSGATLNPGVAPKEIELWARYRIVPLESQNSPSTKPSGWFSGSLRPIERPSSRDEGLGGFNIPGESSLHDVVISALRISYASDPESAYSDDSVLGPNFYRIGKMVYDIHKPHYAQTFQLNTVIDVPTIRVDKVAFRMKSNWGANQTCIYRFRLHGHI